MMMDVTLRHYWFWLQTQRTSILGPHKEIMRALDTDVIPVNGFSLGKEMRLDLDCAAVTSF